MTDEQIYEQLARVMDDVFEHEYPIGPQTVAADVDGWDSVGHIRLVLACEDAFGCTFEPKEVVGLKNVGELVSMIRQKTS